MLGFWRKCRTTLRWLRFAVWSVVLAALLSLAWFNLVGLPDFFKARLVASFHKHGLELEFSRMRLRFVHGFVVENVRVGETKNSTRPALTAGEMQLRLNYSALLHGRLQLDGLVLRDGKFTLTVSPTNSLALFNLQTQLHFPSDDTWALDHFSANFAGAKISLTGEVAHAPEILDWKILAGGKTGGRGALEEPLRQFADTLAKNRFSGQPQISVRLDGDARDIHSFKLQLNAAAAGVATPWFSGRDLQLAANLTAPVGAPTNFDAALGFWTNVQPFRLTWVARMKDLQSKKINADAAEMSGLWRAPELAVTKFSAQLGGGNLAAAARLDVATRELAFTNNAAIDPQALAELLPEKWRGRLAEISWTQPPSLQADGAITLPSWNDPTPDWSAAVETTLRLHGALECSNAVVHGVRVDFVRTHFSCADQVWHLAELELAQGRTKLQLSGQAGAATENFSGQIGGTVDLESARPFLASDRVKRAFDEFKFSEPLSLNVEAAGNLRNLTALSAAGRLVLTGFSLRGQSVESVAADFNCTNRVLDLQLAQGRTQLRLNGRMDATPGNFSGHINGLVDPDGARPFLAAAGEERALDDFKFSGPLALELDAAGNLQNLAALSAAGRLALTNFSVRGQSADSVTGNFSYTNRVLEFLHAELFRADGTQTMTADAVALDFNARMVFFTNGFSTAEPMVVCRAIGPKTASLVEPYEYLSPPTARVNGQLPLREMNSGHDLDGTDMRFDIIRGAPFRWSKLQTTNITGTIHWLGQFLILTNVAAAFYGGQGGGYAFFDFRPVGYGCDFNFGVAVTNVDVQRLAEDLTSSPTNALEGILSGQAAVTNANSKTWRSWNGHGAAQLKNGLLWNIPVFGFLSPVLNTFTPGLGNSRATEARAVFVLTNGVIRSDSLEIQTATMRLQYAGTVDLEQNVNARVTAQLMRNTPVLGSLVSLVLTPVSKIFECQVNGLISDPKVTPIYFPFAKILLAPLHPLRSFEELFPLVNTNAPAK
ncbi:MAG TPA: AsmA-like C-terminal region-containing protein [Verrucomicrobiae bacterium]